MGRVDYGEPNLSTRQESRLSKDVAVLKALLVLVFGISSQSADRFGDLRCADWIKQLGSAEIAGRSSGSARSFGLLFAADTKTVRPREADARLNRTWHGWLADPKNTVLLALAAALLIGGGRKLLQGRRARRAIERLSEPGLTVREVEAVSEHGRAGLMDLFRLLSTALEPAIRDAAGRALSVLWAQDQLIIEEEKAIVQRGYSVTWRARRRYPRAIRGPIPIAVSYGVPFLQGGGTGVGAEQLEWTHRLVGTERAGLESFTSPAAGPGHVAFAIDPRDFPTSGPHRLVLETQARTRGLTSTWELVLPHIAFAFEFDPLLGVDALMTLPDEARGETIARSVRLEPTSNSNEPSQYLDLNDQLVIRDPPVLSIQTPLPCDLAHTLAVEFEGGPGPFCAGEAIVSGSCQDGPSQSRQYPLGPIVGVPDEAFNGPSERRMRAILTSDPHRGWADPDTRSLWPGTLTTDWVSVRIMRR
jgi:hypothetical protein